MNRTFQAGEYFTVPDGTEVSAFLNATDVTQQDLPWDALGELSIASGRVRAGVSSWVHMHPVVSHVTYVVSGALTVRMKARDDADFYDVPLEPGQAAAARPGTLFQLRNGSESDAFVLYIVSPSYVFDLADGQVVYDDAILVASTWEELAAQNYQVPALDVDLDDVLRRREAARRRLQHRKQG